MTTYRRCDHGYFREGWCLHCDLEPKRQPTRRADRLAWLFLLLVALYVAGHAAVAVL